MKNTLILIVLIASLSFCLPSKQGNDSELRDDYALAMAILYNQYSAEYKALTIQAYNIAGERLNSIADTAADLSRLAVVVDIDETVLDNSPYQARAIIENFSYPEGWNEWCNEASADPVPGALNFLKQADSLGFKIFYVSNRKKDEVFESTLNNLLKEDFPQADEESILLRLAASKDNPDPSNKEARRDIIRQRGYNIVLMAGDNLGDFYTDSGYGYYRDQKVISSRDDFGSIYIVLPNAMYGNWPYSIGLDGSAEKTISLLRKMTKR
jgi:5'-nucleotidase (lipoprotein e(P4) family)